MLMLISKMFTGNVFHLFSAKISNLTMPLVCDKTFMFGHLQILVWDYDLSLTQKESAVT